MRSFGRGEAGGGIQRLKPLLLPQSDNRTEVSPPGNVSKSRSGVPGGYVIFATRKERPTGSVSIWLVEMRC